MSSREQERTPLTVGGDIGRLYPWELFRLADERRR